jgi:hypothetical protein
MLVVFHVYRPVLALIADPGGWMNPSVDASAALDSENWALVPEGTDAGT